MKILWIVIALLLLAAVADAQVGQIGPPTLFVPAPASGGGSGGVVPPLLSGAV